MAEALNQLPGFQASSGARELFFTLAPAGEHVVLIAGLPTSRLGWDRLVQWCRRGDAVRVLVLGENRPSIAARVLRLGANGYLDWESPLPVLAKAIRGVHAGELWAERKVALSLVRSPRSEDTKLTPRELNVLQALAEGKRNKEIAAALSISETTVKSHLNRAYHKLNLSDRLQAALYVERHGLDCGP